MLIIKICESSTRPFWVPKYFISVYDEEIDTEYVIGRYWTLTGAKLKALRFISNIGKERTIEWIKWGNNEN